jgi:HlyD family secretion protein
MSPTKSSRIRKLLVPILVVTMLGGAGFGARQALANKKPVVDYQTAAVEQGAVAARVTATGTLSALVTVQVGSQVSGRVKELNANFNSTVKKGDVLAVIDPELFQASLEQAQANVAAASGSLAKARAQLVNMKAQYQRAQDLVKQGLVAEADVDTAKAASESAAADVQAAQGQVAQANAGLHQAQINLQYTKIVSPVDGTVISRNVDVGQTVAAALQAPTLFTIAQDLTAMQVDTSVSESDVGKLSAGMKATFTVDAYPGQKFEGKVREIRNAATTLQNVVTYDAVIDVANGDLRLRPGMTANVTFTYAEADDALLVPNAALRFHPAEAAPAAGKKRAPSGDAPPVEKAVYVLRNGQPARVAIKAGISDGSETQALESTLSPGDKVIIDGGSANANNANTAAKGGGAPGGNAMRGMGKML